MKYTIKVDDFYLEEGELSGELKKYVIERVTDSIWKSIEKRVDDQASKAQTSKAQTSKAHTSKAQTSKAHTSKAQKI